MHSIIDKNNKCIGQYIFMKDDCYTTKIFARFYNMCINKEDTPITEEDVKYAIKMKKYNLDNSIHIYDLNTDSILLKQLGVGSVMIYLAEKNRLYLATEDELNNFVISHNYTTKTSITYILGFPDTYKFRDVKPVCADNISNAIQLYKEKYDSIDTPILIGIKDNDTLYINLNGKVFAIDINEDLVMKPKFRV